MSRRKQTAPERRHGDHDGETEHKMRKGSTSSKEQVAYPRDLRVTPERRKKLEQQIMDQDGMRETRSRRSTAGKKPMRLLDAGVLQHAKRRRSSSVSSSSIKDVPVTTSRDVVDKDKPDEFVCKRRLGVLRRISESPVKKKTSPRGRPPKVVAHRQTEIESGPDGDIADNLLLDDVFHSAPEQMTRSGNDEAEIASVDRLYTDYSDTADIGIPRDWLRKEVIEHATPLNISEASICSPDANSCEGDLDETKAAQPAENGEASVVEDVVDDDSQAVLHDSGNSKESGPGSATGALETVALATEDDIISRPASQGQSASDPGECGSHQGSMNGVGTEGGFFAADGSSDSSESDRWELDEQIELDNASNSDKNDKELAAMQIIHDTKLKEKRRRPMEGSDKRVCDICMESFSNSHELTQHIRKHNAVNSHNCKVCNKTLSSASSLDRHMLIHSGERPFKCTLCPMAFTTNGNMHRHMRTHEKEGTELEDYLGDDYSKPRKRIPSKRQLDSNEDKSLSPVKKITIMDRIVHSPVEDMKVSDGEVLNCPVCSKPFLCKYGLQTHMDLHPNLALKCSLCESLFRNHRGLRMHMHMTHKKSALSSKEEDKIPLGFQDLSFMEFSSSKFPLVAQVWCEQNVRRCNSIEHRFICTVCNKAFPVNSALDLHMKNAHHDQDSKYTESASSNKENELNIAMPLFAPVEKINGAGKEHCQQEFMAALQLKPVTRVKKVTPAAVTSTPGLLMVNGGPLERSITVREFNYNPPMEADTAGEFMYNQATKVDVIQDIGYKVDAMREVAYNPLKVDSMPELCYNPIVNVNAVVANPLLGRKAQIDFSGVQQIFKMTSDSANPLSLLPHQPEQSKRSPLKGSTPGAEMPSDPQASTLPTLLPTPRPNPGYRSEPLSGDVAMEMHFPMEVARHRPQMIPVQPEMTNNIDDDSSSQPGSESDSESLYGVTGLKKFNGMNKNHTCKYCEKTFPFASTLKVHMRSHLGLTPYKCLLCTYSSADKSTLVRHMRTHSGERPYACKLCKFPFTTKANCERHIKKRHNKESKADIELCIATGQMSTTGLDGKFCSPDTICKICNRDFKFFRDLQNHLRVHERTPAKPFVCQRCQMGFTTRGNCARHIIKSHPEVGENNIEQSITVHDVTFSDTQSVATDDSTYLDETMSTDGSPQSEPLDFSMKGNNGRTGHFGANTNSSLLSCIPSPTSSVGSFNFDVPIDLSLPKLAGSTVGKLRFKRVYHKFYSRLVDALVCPHCSQAFAHGSLFKHHIRSHTMERPYRCYFCAAAFTMKENLDKHIEKRHSVNPTTDRPAQAFIPKIATPMQFKLNVARTNQVLRQRSPLDQSEEGSMPVPPQQQQPELSIVTDMMSSLPQNPHQSPVIVNNNYSSADSSVELSSISKILANTSSRNFQNLLTPPLTSNNASPLLMTALSTNPITVNKQLMQQNVQGIPVIVKPVSNGKAIDLGLPYLKQEPRSCSPATSSASPCQAVVDSNNIPDFPIEQGRDSPCSEQDQCDELIPLEKTPAGKELLRKQTCPYCFRKFPWISSLKRHILTHTGIKPYQCPHCGSSFSTKSNCERHIVRRHCGGNRGQSHDGSPAETPPSAHMSPREQLFVCLECNDVAFSTNKKLHKHYESHHPTEPFPECYKKEIQNLSLSEGMQHVSSSFALDLTTKTPPATRVRLPSYHNHHHHHQRSSAVKEGRRLLKKATAMKIKKRTHEYGQIHEDDDIPVQDASNCSQYEASSSGSTYNNLVMKFTMKPSQHSCNMCSKRFKSSTALKRHNRVHTLEHPFQCLKCQASFTTKFNCQRHMQKLHGMSKEEAAMVKEVEVINRVSDLPTMVTIREPGQIPIQHVGGIGHVTDSESDVTEIFEKMDSSKSNEGLFNGNLSNGVAEIFKSQAESPKTLTSDRGRTEDHLNNIDVSKGEMASNIPFSKISKSGTRSHISVIEADKSDSYTGPELLNVPDENTANARSQSMSTNLTVIRTELCNTPDGDDDEENEDIKKFKELDPDITLMTHKITSDESEESNNMTWTLDSNVTASPEREASFIGNRLMGMSRSSPKSDSSDVFSSAADGMISSGMKNSDIIQNLLGIQDPLVIDQMLDTGDSQTAAKLLGV